MANQANPYPRYDPLFPIAPNPYFYLYEMIRNGRSYDQVRDQFLRDFTYLNGLNDADYRYLATRLEPQSVTTTITTLPPPLNLPPTNTAIVRTANADGVYRRNYYK